jgi:hypothetical protein
MLKCDSAVSLWHRRRSRPVGLAAAIAGGGCGGLRTVTRTDRSPARQQPSPSTGVGRWPARPGPAANLVTVVAANARRMADREYVQIGDSFFPIPPQICPKQVDLEPSSVARDNTVICHCFAYEVCQCFAQCHVKLVSINRRRRRSRGHDRHRWRESENATTVARRRGNGNSATVAAAACSTLDGWAILAMQARP